MRLKTSSRLALYAAIELAGAAGAARSAGELAATCGASANHMAKVLQVLARAGLVAPSRGAQGGYRFAGNARRTTLLDVIALFEPIAVTPPAPAGAPAHLPAAAALDAVLAEIDDIARATLGSITLETIRRAAAGPGGA